MTAAGYIASFFIGLTLGLLGGGGSILTVPVLVYLFGIEPVLATSYSLFIVGTTSLTGVITKIAQRQVEWMSALIFGLPSLIMVFLTRKFILPAIPHVLFTVRGLEVTRPKFLLLLFAAMMILAAFRMIREKKRHAGEDDEPAAPHHRVMLVVEGIIVGLLAGLVGAGGGFLIIPALVLFGGMNMKKAVGTSLLIIATNSLIGVIGDLEEQYVMDWRFLLAVTAIAVAGILLGNALSHRFSSKSLKKAFGWLVLAMGIWILAKEAFF